MNEPVAIADGQDDVLPAQGPEPPVVVFVRDEIAWILEVYGFVVVAAQKAFDVGQAAHAQDASDLIRVTESDGKSMECPKARTRCNGERMRIPPMAPGKH